MKNNFEENKAIEEKYISKWKLHCMWISSLIVFIGVLYFEYSNGH